VLAAFDPNSFRWGSSSAPWHETVVIVLVIAVMAVACVLVLRSVRRRHQRPMPVGDQWQALAVMGELCPHGWQAQITLYGGGAPMPVDAPHARVPLVGLEWRQFDGGSGEVAVARRVWAQSIDGALQTMVDDRRIDIALEQIERAAAEGRHA
jgi:hypothetical protein